MTELINKEELLRRFADFGQTIPKDQVFGVIASIKEVVRCKEIKERVMGFSGYRIGNTTIGITQMPDRKRPCLYVMKGNTLYPVAYFTKYELAEMFAEELDRFLLHGERSEDE